MRNLAIAALAVVALGAAIAWGQTGPVTAAFSCNNAAVYDASTNGSTKLVTGVANQRIYICGFNILAGGTANVKLIYGTGGTCGSGTTAITPAYSFTAQTGIVDHPPFYSGLVQVPASNDLCLNTSAGVAVQSIVYYGLSP